MKTLASMLLFFLLLTPTISQGQRNPEDSSILVIKNSWAKVRYRANWDRQSWPDQYTNPRDPNSTSDPILLEQNVARERRNLGRVVEGYVYKATFKNISSKTVVLIGWDYSFIESEGKQ